MQSPPVGGRRGGLCQRRAVARQWETQTAGGGAWEGEKPSDRIAALPEGLVFPSDFLRDSYNYLLHSALAELDTVCPPGQGHRLNTGAKPASQKSKIIKQTS